jgi:carbon monoxide dehydrogenase subunit G
MHGASGTLVRARQSRCDHLKSKGIGSSSEVETALTLTPHEQGTKIRWTADVKSLGGLLKMVPTGLIRGAANKVIEDTWTGVTTKLQG